MRLIVFLLATVSVATAQSAIPSQQVWEMQESGSTASLRGIDSVDGTVAWASGSGGTVLRTVDGGAHWTQCAVPDGDHDGATLDFRGVQARNSDTAIVMASGPGDKSRLYETSDGCQTWSILLKNPDKDGFWDGLSVRDKKIEVFGDPVAGKFVIEDSGDGGTTWKRDNGLPPSLASEGAFAASNTAFLVDWNDGIEMFGTGGPNGSRVFTNCNPCTTKPFDRVGWDVRPLPMFKAGQASGIFSISARLTAPNMVFVAVGGDYSKPDQAGTAAHCSRWLNWNASTTPPRGYRSTVQWGESIQAWITAGTNGSDISRDDGKTWQPLDNGNWNALSLPFIVGPKGRIARLNPVALPKP